MFTVALVTIRRRTRRSSQRCSRLEGGSVGRDRQRRRRRCRFRHTVRGVEHDLVGTKRRRARPNDCDAPERWTASGWQEPSRRGEDPECFVGIAPISIRKRTTPLSGQPRAEPSQQKDGREQPYSAADRHLPEARNADQARCVRPTCRQPQGHVVPRAWREVYLCFLSTCATDTVRGAGVRTATAGSGFVGNGVEEAADVWALSRQSKSQNDEVFEVPAGRGGATTWHETRSKWGSVPSGIRQG